MNSILKTMITVNLGNVKEVTETIKKAQDFVLSATTDPKFLDKAGFILSASATRNISDGEANGTTYTVLKESTLKQKLKKDKNGKSYTSQPLLRTGELRKSINYNINGGSLLMSMLDYGEYHQTGTPNMAKRLIFAPDSTDIDEIEDVLKNSIVAKMKSL